MSTLIDYPEGADDWPKDKLVRWVTYRILERLQDPIVMQAVGRAVNQERKIHQAFAIKEALLTAMVKIDMSDHETLDLTLACLDEACYDDDGWPALRAGVVAYMRTVNKLDDVVAPEEGGPVVEPMQPEEVDRIMEDVRQRVKGTKDAFQGDEHKCGQEGCEVAATHRFWWPTEEAPKLACGAHATKAVSVGRAMGFPVRVEEIDRR